jgi:ribonuclease BN (tRNA processing enzyme)
VNLSPFLLPFLHGVAGDQGQWEDHSGVFESPWPIQSLAEAPMTVLRLCASATLALVVARGAASVQLPASSQSPPRTQILFLGTAGGPPLRADRSEPATLLTIDGRRYLIDCGIGTARRLVEAGVRSETIGTIFLTHLHPDHDLGLVGVLANDIQSRGADTHARLIDVYGPPQTKELIDAAYRFVGIPYAVFAAEGGGPTGGKPAGSPFVVHEFHPGVVYQDDNVRVTAVENSHYALMPQKFRATMKSYAFRFETPHGVVVFTGDTGPNDDVVRLALGADVLVSEVEDFAAISAFADRIARQYHWSPERRNRFYAHMTKEHLDIRDVGQMAARAHVKSVVLYHWDPSDPAAYVAGVKKYYSGRVFASADLQRYCLNAAPSQGKSGHSPLQPCGDKGDGG